MIRVEQRDAVAEKHRHEMEIELVQTARGEGLLCDVRTARLF